KRASHATTVAHLSNNARVPSGRTAWVLLAYRLPREPSTPRSALWRKLRRLGAAQVLDGLAALPLDARNREQLEWLAEEVVDAGGEATIWVGELGSATQERELASRMAEAVAAESRGLIDDALAAKGDRPGQRRRKPGRPAWRCRCEASGWRATPGSCSRGGGCSSTACTSAASAPC